MTATATPDSAFVPTGEPDQRDRDRFIAAYLLLSLGDLDAAEMLWREHVSPSYAGMLDGSAGWAWDDATQTYRSRHGRTIDTGDLKRLSLTFNGSADHDLRRSASDMSVGLVTVGEWQRHSAQLVKDLYLADAALAVGGFANLTDELKQAAVGKPDEPPGLAYSLGRLWRFGRDIGTSRNDSEDAVVNRASLYSAAANGVYENARRESHKRASDGRGRLTYLYERNRLGPAERHCETSVNATGCLECTEAGWLPIGSLPLPGVRSCGPRCQCELEFSLTGEQHEGN